jgi:dolichyl-phosphate-mannose--protein O-mannosyl transferase
MLDPPMLLFSMTMVLTGLLVTRTQDERRRFAIVSVLFGASFGLLMATKVLGLAMALFIPWVLWTLLGNRQRLGMFLGFALLGGIVPYVVVWQTHFSLAKNINPALPDAGYYQASPAYQDILREGAQGNLGNFPVMLRDSLAFLGHYSRGVPRLNLCKEDENGSLSIFWPLGARTISYRWETADGERFRYLYLVANPVSWTLGLLGVILGAGLLAAQIFLPLRQNLSNSTLLFVLLATYGGYMAAVSRLDRVMYLYHYFLPLMLSFLLFGVVALEIVQLGPWKITERLRTVLLLSCAVAVFAGHQWMRPLTYYEPISDAALAKRNFLSIWELRCANCVHASPLAIPSP